MDELLTIKQVSLRLKTNVATVYKLIHDGKLMALTIGNMKVRASTLDRFLANEEARQNPEKEKQDA